MAKSYVRTAAANDTTALLLKKMDEVIAALGAGNLMTKFNTLQSSYAALVTAYNTLQSSYAAAVTAYNTLQSSYAAVITKLNLELALTQGPYVDGSGAVTDGTGAAVDGTTAATSTCGAVTTADSELM